MGLQAYQNLCHRRDGGRPGPKPAYYVVVTTGMLVSRAMPSKSRQSGVVSFLHLSCAALFRVDSELAWAWPPSVPPEQDLGRGWQILVMKPDGRDDFKRLSALAKRRWSAHREPDSARRGEAADLVHGRLPPSLRGRPPGDSDEVLTLYCPKCCVWISIPTRRLTDRAERHPGHEADEGTLVAYVADRGEVVFLYDAYAEELVRRDRRARRRQPSSAPGSLKRSDTWTPVRTAPKGR